MDNVKLNILLLGPPLVQYEGKPVRIHRQQPRALLYYLAAQTQPTSRDELCELFWPGEKVDLARKNLRETISHLRKDLPDPEALISDNDYLSLDPVLVFSDVLEFNHIVAPFLLMTQSPAYSEDIIPGWRVAELATAMELCRAYTFLPGMQMRGSPGFQNWVELTNQILRVAILRVINALVDYYISIGDLDTSLVWLRKGLEIDPLNFDMNYLSLTCLRDKGMSKELINFVNYLESMYPEHGEPLPQQFQELRAKAEESNRLGKVSSVNLWPVEEKDAPRFFGREDELAFLNRLMRRKGILELRGESGSGKTRLIREFFETQSFPPRLLYFRGHQLAVRVPFQTIIEGLPKVMTPEDWALIDAHDRELLSDFYNHQLHDLKTLAGLDTVNGWLPVFENVFQSFLRLLEKIALERSVLFVLDDACWCDPASLTLIGFLIEHDFFKKSGVLILVTCPRNRNEALEQLVNWLKRERKLESITVNEFPIAETRKFVQMMMGINPDPIFLQRVQINTGGNPFYLVEFIQAIKNSRREISSYSEKNPLPIPETIQALVYEKMRSLSKNAVRIIQAAAVNGNSFSADVLELMVRMENEQFLQALEEIRAAGFVKVDKDFGLAGGYVFQHDVERYCIESELDPARRRDLHLKVANAVLKRRGRNPETGLRLAHHFEVAGEFVRAVEFWTYAGVASQRQPDPQVVYRHFSRALELVKHNLSLFNDQQILDLVNKWADYAYDLNDNEICRQIYRTCLDIGYDLQSSLLIGAGNSGLGRYNASIGKFDTAIFYFGHGSAQLKKAGNLAEIYETFCRLGILYIKMDQYKQAAASFEEGLRQIGNLKGEREMETRINLLTQICILYCFQGQPQRAYQLASEMGDLSLLVSRPAANLQAASILMMTLFYNHRFQDVLSLFGEYKRLSESPPVREWLTLIDLARGTAYLYLGDLDNTWKLIHQAYLREESHPYEKLIDSTRVFKGDLYRLLEEYDKAMEFYQQAIDNGGKAPPAVEARLKKGLLLLYRGNPEEGIACIEKCIALSEEQGFISIGLEARLVCLLFQTKPIDEELIESEAFEIVAEMKARGLMSADFYELYIPAFFALERKQNGKALELFQQMSAHFRQEPNFWAELYALRNILCLAAPKSGVYTAARARLRKIMEEMGKHATVNPVKSMYTKLRKKRFNKDFVNVLSTAILYK